MNKTVPNTHPLNLGGPSSLCHLGHEERMTTMRYSLFYSDDFVSDCSKMKALIKFDHKGEMIYDKEMMETPKFKKFLVDTGLFFSIDVSPLSPIANFDRPQHGFGQLCEKLY